MFYIDILTLFALFGTFQGLIFAALFWYKNKKISNKIFALLLVATSLRIVKNVFVHLRDLNPELFINLELWRVAVYWGISHQLAIGPLFLIYFQSKLNPKFKWEKSYLWHFSPYLIFLIISLFVEWPFWQKGGLWTCYISILVYYLLTFRDFYQCESQVDSGTSSWLKGLLIIVAIMMLSYSPVLFHYIGYVGGAFMYTLAILGTGYVMLTNKGKFSFFRTKYETSSLSSDQAIKIKQKLEKLISQEKPFLDAELTLKKLATQLEIPPHHLSRVINQEFKMNFSDYINSFRLAEATKRLIDPKYKHLKISALAYECGFNSVPTFNTLFKKVHKTTPTNYRRNF